MIKKNKETSQNKCRPGSIEQELDMCETGPLRGDKISHDAHESDLEGDAFRPGFRVDMSEPGREGDEESGDDHSSGFQGDEAELDGQKKIDSGLGGELTRKKERKRA